jgi:uncharacterized delta-60 repeat protein
MRRTWLPIAVLLAFLAPGAPGQSRTPEGPRAAGGPARAAAVVGALDPTFGSGGKVTTDFFGDQDQASDLAVQSDGRLVVAGVARRPGGKASFALARYDLDGSLDASFGSGGKVTADFSDEDEGATALAIQADGKLVVAGATCATGISPSCSDFAVARFNADGSPDASFGSAGKVTTDVMGGFDAAVALAVQPDGKVLAAGVACRGAISPHNADFALVRYNPDGSLDEGFGEKGKAVTDFTGGFDGPFAVVIQPDGKVLLGGTAGEGAAYRDFGLARYNPDGSPDTSFGSGGKQTTNFGSENDGNDAIADLAVLADGKILAAGASERRTTGAILYDFALARYNPDGSLDPSFGTGGKVTTDVSPVDDQGGSAIVQSDGKVLLAGIAGGVLDVGLQGPVILYEEESSTTRCDIALVRYNADGGVDDSFGTAGKLTTDFFGSSDAARFVRQADGKVVGAGFARRERSSTFFGSRLISKWAGRLGAAPDADFALLRFDTGDIAGPDFTLAADPPAATAARRARVPVAIDVARLGGFSGEVTVVAPDTRAIKVKVTPARSTASGGRVTFNLKVKKQGVLGTHELVFTGRDSEGRERTAAFALTIE